MTRRHMTTARRLRIFQAAGGICHLCGGKIDGARERWDADHVIALELSGDDSDDNLRPAHEACHRHKSTTQDIPRIAKAKRGNRKHIGAHRPKSKIPGSKGTGFRKKLDGTVERLK